MKGIVRCLAFLCAGVFAIDISEMVLREVQDFLMPGVKLACLNDPEIPNELRACAELITNEELKQEIIKKGEDYEARKREFCDENGNPKMQAVMAAALKERQEFLEDKHKERYLSAIPVKACIKKLFAKHGVK